ncbi:MAG TPA: prolyl oligopeptidase family serine peptidase, partial [Candidatus Baltobacteraceae bacterium]|nr:prolyl oligopeptidase family serine peptidase [Candidatus Baltobacteraceae bacterium]
VPITQSYEFFHALSERGVPVKFAVFPGSTHGPSSEAQSQTLTRMWLQWLDRYLRIEAPKR